MLNLWKYMVNLLQFSQIGHDEAVVSELFSCIQLSCFIENCIIFMRRTFCFKELCISKMVNLSCIIIMLCSWIPLENSLNSLRPNEAIWHTEMQSTLIKVMTCNLFGTKPLPETALTHCQLDPLERISMKVWSKYDNFLSRLCICKVVFRMLAICLYPKINSLHAKF